MLFRSTVSLWLLLCPWPWGILLGEVQGLPVNDCPAASCDSGALARGRAANGYCMTYWRGGVGTQWLSFGGFSGDGKRPLQYTTVQAMLGAHAPILWRHSLPSGLFSIRAGASLACSPLYFQQPTQNLAHIRQAISTYRVSFS